MKEHAIFLEAGFTPKNKNLANDADQIKTNFERFLNNVLNVSQNNISQNGFMSQDMLTNYTLKAENKTMDYSGIVIDTSITMREAKLMENNIGQVNIVKYLDDINNQAIMLIDEIINFKTKLLYDVNNCNIFTANYPLLIEHILNEARYYREVTEGFLKGKYIETLNPQYTKKFWNRIMMEHSEFIRGLLDPTEKELMKMANDFALAYENIQNGKVYDQSYNLTVQLRNYKEKGTAGILDCKIKSIILPLLGDHVLREANHYLKLMKMMNINN